MSAHDALADANALLVDTENARPDVRDHAVQRAQAHALIAIAEALTDLVDLARVPPSTPAAEPVNRDVEKTTHGYEASPHALSLLPEHSRVTDSAGDEWVKREGPRGVRWWFGAQSLTSTLLVAQYGPIYAVRPES